MKNHTNVRYLAQLAVLVAIELVLAYTPIGYLRLAPGLEVSFLMIPVTLGGMLLGPAAGAVLGGVFGLTSFGACFSSAFGLPLLAVNPFYTFLACVPSRILAGWLAALAFKALASRKKPTPFYAYGTAALAGPVLNTVFFMGALVLFFYKTEYIQGFAAALGATNPVLFIALFVGFQGLVEAAVGCIVSTILATAISRGLKRA